MRTEAEARRIITWIAAQGLYGLHLPHSLTADILDSSPSAWFARLKNHRRVTLGKEEGFLHLTRAGYQANKEALLAVYASAGGIPAVFKLEAEKELARREAALRKEADRLRALLAQAESILAGGGW